MAEQSLPQIEWFTNAAGSGATVAFIAAAERGKTAIREACLELRRQVDLINADRIAFLTGWGQQRPIELVGESSRTSGS